MKEEQKEMFLRRLFYDLTTGDMLKMSLLMGAAIAPSVDEEAEGLVGWGVVEWTAPDAEAEAAMSTKDADGNPRTVTVTVDVKSVPPKPVYTYAPVEDGTVHAGEMEDMQTALNLLGVEVE